MIIVGIDPDASGGICRTDGKTYACEHLRFNDAVRNREVLRSVCNGADSVYVESIPMIRGNGHIGSATRRIRYGAMLERLHSLGVRVVEVPPVTWQGALSLTAGRGEGRPAHKARMAKVARRICPDVPDALADAVLIAYYGSRTEAKHVSAAQGN